VKHIDCENPCVDQCEYSLGVKERLHLVAADAGYVDDEHDGAE
jgi:hypothetical protein